MRDNIVFLALLTAVYIFVVFVGYSDVAWGFLDRAASGKGVELNELGDFLAGLFAPVAAVWLIGGYLMQAAELRNSVEALSAQSRELAAANEHHREQVEVNGKILELSLRAEYLRQAEREIHFKPNLVHGGQKVSGERVKLTLINIGHDASALGLNKFINCRVSTRGPGEGLYQERREKKIVLKRLSSGEFIDLFLERAQPGSMVVQLRFFGGLGDQYVQKILFSISGKVRVQEPRLVGDKSKSQEMLERLAEIMPRDGERPE